ncbi:MAG: hypothetical protein ABSA75_11820 [Candidatus Bathyarchaeia archaeon]|jgi:hypothetical protein
MKRCGRGQVQDVACESVAPLSAGTKCVTVALFEKEGKTILQPLVTEQEVKAIRELFRSETLEVWLSNGKSDYSVFNVDILKYKQVPQPLTKCNKIANQVCLKNLFESIVRCAQCPLGGEAGGCEIPTIERASPEPKSTGRLTRKSWSAVERETDARQ